MMTLDTSGIFALLNRRDPDHDSARALLLADDGPFVVPAGILAEVAYMVERTLTPASLDAFLEDLHSGALTLDCGEEDLTRVRALVRRYADLPLGFADAAVAACAERRGGCVLTFDWRHFGVLARAGLVTIAPAEEPLP